MLALITVFNQLKFRCRHNLPPLTDIMCENPSHSVFKWGGLYSTAFESSEACKMLLILLSDTTQLFCLNKQTHNEYLSLCYGYSLRRHSCKDHFNKPARWICERLVLEPALIWIKRQWKCHAQAMIQVIIHKWGCLSSYILRDIVGDKSSVFTTTGNAACSTAVTHIKKLVYFQCKSRSSKLCHEIIAQRRSCWIRKASDGKVLHIFWPSNAATKSVLLYVSSLNSKYTVFFFLFSCRLNWKKLDCLETLWGDDIAEQTSGVELAHLQSESMPPRCLNHS